MIKEIREDRFGEFFNIIEKSFPADEYRPRQAQLGLFSKDEYRVYAKCDGEKMLAVIALWDFGRFAYIEHFAVDPQYRGNRLGSVMLGEVTEKLNKPICLEVELPDTEIAKRRIGFYERNGFTLNSYPYIQPPLAKGQNSLPLMIMTTGGSISEPEFERIKATLYSRVYEIEKNF